MVEGSPEADHVFVFEAAAAGSRLFARVGLRRAHGHAGVSQGWRGVAPRSSTSVTLIGVRDSRKFRAPVWGASPSPAKNSGVIVLMPSTTLWSRSASSAAPGGACPLPHPQMLRILVDLIRLVCSIGDIDLCPKLQHRQLSLLPSRIHCGERWLSPYLSLN